MKNVRALAADDILSIQLEQPERLYSDDLTVLKAEYRQLASKWHPDKGGRDDVFQHIRVLFNCAELKILEGTWEEHGVLLIKTKDKTFQSLYFKKRTFELGDMFIGKGFVSYRIEKENKDLIDIAVKRIRSLTFTSPIEKKTEPFLPKISGVYETDKHWIVMIHKKESICLADLLEHQGGKLDPKHVAWIISRLYNLAAYLGTNRLTHNDFSIDSIFIDPVKHTAELLGGWWYSQREGEKLVAASRNTVKLIPHNILSKKIADPQIDLNLIRGVGRTLLGDAIGNTLVSDKDLPKALVSWLRGASAGHALKDYKAWQEKVLIDSFGERKFVNFDVSFHDVYGK